MDLSAQVALQQQLNKALQERTRLLEEHNKQLQTQSDLAAQIGDNLGDPRSSRRMRDMSSSIRASSDGLRDAIEGARNYDQALNDAADAAEEAADSTSILSSAISGLTSAVSAVASGMFSLVKGGFNMLISGLKTVGNFVLNVTSSLGKLAFSILSFPFTMFDWLVSAAQEGGGGGNPLREAMEELRETLGDLASGTSKDVISSFKEIRKQGNMLGETGLSIRKVFGYGRQGMAEYLKDLTATLVATGDNLHRLSKQFLAMGGNLVVFQRGIGLSKEELAELGNIAEMRGQDIAKSFTEFGSIAIKTGKRFGIDVKDMAKGMKELSLDVENFGHLGPKAFAPITAYARKLGLEIKDMAGIMDKLSGFADTTETASKLGQAFGMNVDSMQLMAAQNPAEKIDILRKSFFSAGKDLGKLNYQQRKYLSSLTGLQGKSLEAAFALDKQGLSYSNIQEASDKANESQMTQKEVMQELSKNIKRLIQSGGGRRFSGFFDAFIKGFERGVLKSKEFRKVFRNINRGLKIMYRLGIDVGRAFVKYFPGVKKMLKALSDMFDPKQYLQFRSKAFPVFEAFFKDLDFDKFFKNITKVYKEAFGIESTKDLLSGFDTFMNALTKIAGKAMAKLISIVMEGMLFIGKLILDPKKAIDSLKGGAGAIGGALSKYTDNLMDPTIELIEKENKEGGLLGQLKETYKEIFKRFSNWLKTTVPAMLKSGWASITSYFSDGGEGEKTLDTVKKYVTDLWDKTLKPALTELWKQVKAWWNSPETEAIKKDISDLIERGLTFAFDSAVEWAKNNPGKAAAIFAIMFPQTSMSIVNLVGKFLVNGISGAWRLVGASQGVMSAARTAMEFLTQRAGPGLMNLGRSVGGMVMNGIKMVGGGSAGAGMARLGLYGAVAAILYKSINRTREILNDPQMKKTGITTGEALGAGYLETIAGSYANSIAENMPILGEKVGPYSAEQILAHTRKLSKDAQARMDEALREDAKRSAETFNQVGKEGLMAIAKAKKSGNKAEVERLLKEQYDTMISQQYLKILNDPKTQQAMSEADSDMHMQIIKQNKIIARKRAEAMFDPKKIEAQADALVKSEEDKKTRELEAKAFNLGRKARLAETLAKLADVPKKLEAAMAGVANVNGEKIMKDAIQLSDKLGMILHGLDPLLEIVSEVITTQAKFSGLASRLKSIDKISASLNLVNIGKLPQLGPQISRFVKSLSRAAKSITDAEVKKIEPIVKAVKGFKGGKVVVQSNLPDKFDIHLNVEIQAREVANAVSKISLKPSGGYIQTGPEKTNT